MIKSIVLAACAVALGLATAVVPVTPAKAQYYGTVTCQAQSPYATGVWVHSNLNYACARALQECAVRSPLGSVCTVTRWWYN